MKSSIYKIFIGFIIGMFTFLLLYRIDMTRKNPTFTYKPYDKIPSQLDMCKKAIISWEKWGK